MSDEISVTQNEVTEAQDEATVAQDEVTEAQDEVQDEASKAPGESTVAQGEAEEMSDYEKIRQVNIAEREAVLASLDLVSEFAALKKDLESERAANKARPKKKYVPVSRPSSLTPIFYLKVLLIVY